MQQKNGHNIAKIELLTPDEKLVCEKIVALEEAPHSQRASMLLALNAGKTQSKSASQAGITLGNLKYWLKKFRASRMAIFPEVLQDSFELAVETPSATTESETEPPLKTKKLKTMANKAEKKKKKTKKVKSKKEKKSKKKKDAKGKPEKNKAGKKQKKSKKDKKKPKKKKSKK